MRNGVAQVVVDATAELDLPNGFAQVELCRRDEQQGAPGTMENTLGR